LVFAKLEMPFKSETGRSGMVSRLVEVCGSGKSKEEMARFVSDEQDFLAFAGEEGQFV